MDPNVTFLYRAMRERDPRKRKVKPVAPENIQISFDGYDDSEDDSDFDITKHDDELNNEADLPLDDDICDESDPGTSDDDSDEDDEEFFESNCDDNGDKSAEPQEERKDDSEAVKDVVMDEDDDEAEIESMTETESESEDEDSDSDAAGEEALSKDDDDGEKDMLSPPIKSLGNMLNSIDSDEDDEDYVPRKRRKKKDSKAPLKTSKTEEPQKKDKTMATAQSSYEVAKENQRPQKRIKVIVCCVCLSDKSSEEEEIVECDSCGVSVHEGCYGISESHSIASTESSASTEPWFCDACKANAKPVCELCPNSGGVFKETDAGKWVHLVCALYTPGVAFGDVEKLNLVTLFEMPYSRWGARECILCEDRRFSQTGVCINCDAGMCKAYFHVTCAQRQGLLAELSPEDVLEVADPFFAYCKLHADKYQCKMKRRNWLAIQSHAKSYTPCPIVDEKEKARFQRKLAHHREKYGLSRLKKPPAWVPTQKMIRHLHTSPSALKGFLRKAELMGIITQVQNAPLENKEAHKKPPVGHVSFTSDFISYFMERNVKVDNLKLTLSELTGQNKRLQTQEDVVRRQYEKINTEVNALKQTSNALRMEGESLCGMLGDIYGMPVPNIPEVFIGRKKRAGALKKEISGASTELINQCGMCHQTTEQHLLAKCDKCRQHYHLGCLDPPLTRMPKKTKLFGWQCSFCVKCSSGDSVKSHPDVNQPRRLRETIKNPDKYFLLSHIQESLYSRRKKTIQSRKSRKKRQATLARLAQRQGEKADKGKSSIKWFGDPPASKPSKGKPLSYDATSSSSSATIHNLDVYSVPNPDQLYALDIICVVCNEEGQVADTVRCDDCMLSYHLRCLSPPMKKSPKVRGYAWHCEACDMSNSDEEVRGRRSQRYEVTSAVNRPSVRVATNSVVFDVDVSSDCV